MAQRSTVMLQDGTNRLAHLVRGDDGLYTFEFAGAPDTEKWQGSNGFEVDLTQAVYQAMRREIVLNSPLYQKALRAAKEEIEGGR